MNTWDTTYYRTYFQHLDGIEGLYLDGYDELARVARRAELGSGDRFAFRQNKRLSEATDSVLKSLSAATVAAIAAGTTATWSLSNIKNDAITAAFIRGGGIPDRYLQHNAAKLAAFQNRKIGGMQLSSRVWNYTADLKSQLETAINAALQNGTSAQDLARTIKRYLKDPDALFRAVNDPKTGRFTRNPLYYDSHPGTGVYRSAHKNAMRLAGTEINRAYRESDLLRWSQMDFVVGYQIKTSLRKLTVCPLCETMAGLYPKPFVWTGWHSQCRCYATPVLMTEAEFLSDATTSIHEVRDVPDGFKQYLHNHRDSIQRAVDRGRTPYWVADNLGGFVKL